jgi:hypothetical protein
MLKQGKGFYFAKPKPARPGYKALESRHSFIIKIFVQIIIKNPSL